MRGDLITIEDGGNYKPLFYSSDGLADSNWAISRFDKSQKIVYLSSVDLYCETDNEYMLRHYICIVVDNYKRSIKYLRRKGCAKRAGGGSVEAGSDINQPVY